MSSHLPDDVRAALNRGDKIAAIRLLRERMGIGLAEAKAAVDAGEVASPQHAAPSTDQLPREVMEALDAGRKIEAIKLLREATGLGLKEAKLRVDAATTQRGPALASGEVPRSRFGSGFLLVIVAIVLAVLGWLLLRGA